MKRKRLSPGRFLVLINLAWFAIVAILLFAVQWQQERLLAKGETVRYLAQEIRWQRYATDKANAQIVSLPEFQFLAQALATKDGDIYAVAKAAWKWGKAYGVSPHLIMAVAHRESNFDPAARSYDKAGNELAMGIMQINYQVWKDELKLDPARMDDVDYNVQQGALILKHYLDKSPGDVGAALFAYWGGALAGGRYTYPPRVLESKFFNTSPIGLAQ